MLTSGAANQTLGSRALDCRPLHPLPLSSWSWDRGTGPRFCPVTPSHSLPLFSLGGGRCIGRAFETWGKPSTSLGLCLCLPLPRKGKGTIEVKGWRFPEGHGAKHGTVIIVIMRTHPGQKPARRLSGPPGLGP